MDASAEQLVLDYLRRLGDAAHRVLRPDERVAFMTRSRAVLAGQIAERRAAGAGDVLRLLSRFGEPEELAARERQRLDAAAAASRRAGPATAAEEPGDPAGQRRGGWPGTNVGGAAGTGGGGAAGTGGRAAGMPVTPSRQRSGALPAGRRPFVVPSLHRPMTARLRPGDGLAAVPQQRGWMQPQGSGPAQAADPADPPDRSSPSSPAPDPTPADRPAPNPARPSAQASPDPPTPASSGPASPDRPASASSGPATPPDAAPETQGSHWGRLLALVRRHPLETAAVLLLGLGGLIAPFPLWLLGAVAVIASRLWDARDKWAALAVPVAFALIGAIAIAGLTARSGSLAGYFSTVRIDGWDLLRAGSVAGAAYLAWRVRQGRRPRREPPWRRPPHG